MPLIQQPGSAMDALMNRENRELRLYMDKPDSSREVDRQVGALTCTTRDVTSAKYYLVQDQIEHIYNVLEKLIDHQADIEGRSGLQVTPR